MYQMQLFILMFQKNLMVLLNSNKDGRKDTCEQIYLQALFFWQRNNPIMSLIFYAGLALTVLSPIITIVALYTAFLHYTIFCFRFFW